MQSIDGRDGRLNRRGSTSRSRSSGSGSSSSSGSSGCSCSLPAGHATIVGISILLVLLVRIDRRPTDRRLRRSSSAKAFGARSAGASDPRLAGWTSVSSITRSTTSPGESSPRLLASLACSTSTLEACQADQCPETRPRAQRSDVGDAADPAGRDRHGDHDDPEDGEPAVHAAHEHRIALDARPQDLTKLMGDLPVPGDPKHRSRRHRHTSTGALTRDPDRRRSGPRPRTHRP